MGIFMAAVQAAGDVGVVGAVELRMPLLLADLLSHMMLTSCRGLQQDQPISWPSFCRQ